MGTGSTSQWANHFGQPGSSMQLQLVRTSCAETWAVAFFSQDLDKMGYNLIVYIYTSICIRTYCDKYVYIYIYIYVYILYTCRYTFGPASGSGQGVSTFPKSHVWPVGAVTELSQPRGSQSVQLDKFVYILMSFSYPRIDIPKDLEIPAWI